MRHVDRARWIAVLLGAAAMAGCTDRGRVTAAEFGEKWPLTVDHGSLRCEGPGQMATFVAPDGRQYALNGTAKGSNRFLDPAPIWKTQPPRPVSTVVDRIPEPDRQAIFRSSVEAVS